MNIIFIWLLLIGAGELLDCPQFQRMAARSGFLVRSIKCYWFAVICTLGTAALVLAIHLNQKHLMDHLRQEDPKRVIEGDGG